MNIITETEKIKLKNSIVTLGKFDGSHIGHQLLFETAIAEKRAGDSVVIFTFDVPPAAVVGKTGNEMAGSLYTREERLRQGWPEGVDHMIEFPFNEETRQMSPEDFVKEILVDRLGVKAVIAGMDFRFGKDRAGSVDTLAELGEKYGFRVIPVEKVKYTFRDQSGTQEVSSTLIKQELRKGNLEDVNAMLGRPFFMLGTVTAGKRFGRTIGFPTINFPVPENKILPPNGVYATRTIIDGRAYDSITNIGIRPTFDDGTLRTVETNIFDFEGDLYGKKLRVDFYRFIRPEQKFASFEELRQEIENNKQEVKTYFETEV